MVVNPVDHFRQPSIPNGCRNAPGVLLPGNKHCRGNFCLGWRTRLATTYPQHQYLGADLYLASGASISPHGRSDVPVGNSHPDADGH